MKKIFSVIVALTIIASMSVSAFAAVTMSPFVFRGVGEDGNTYIYHFGTRDNTEEEVGIEINGEKYAALNFDAVTNTKFGIGIADPSNKLGDTYEVLPYAGESYGKAVTVDKNSLSNAVFNATFENDYVAEPEIPFVAAYGTDNGKLVLIADSTTTTNKTVSATGRPAGDGLYAKNFLRFDISAIESIANGRKIELIFNAFGSTAILNNGATLEVYGVTSEGEYSDENLPARDDASGPIASVKIDQSICTGVGADSKRLSVDLTNYIQQKIYKNEDTATISFKITDFEKDPETDSATVMLYIVNVNMSNANVAMRYTGSYEVEKEEALATPKFSFASYAMRHTSNSEYRKPSTEYVQQVVLKNNTSNAPHGYLQWNIPEDFKGVDANTRLELVAYAYHVANKDNSNSADKDATLRVKANANEYDINDAIAAGVGKKWTTNYPIERTEEFDFLGDAFLIPATSTANNPVEIKVDITDYVLQKYANGEKTVSFAFDIQYDRSAGDITQANYIYTNITTPSASTGFIPYIQYNIDGEEFVGDGTGIVSVVGEYQATGMWSTKNDVRIESGKLAETEDAVLRFKLQTGADERTYTKFLPASSKYDTYVTLGERYVYDISELTRVKEGQKVYLNFSYQAASAKNKMIITTVKPGTVSFNLTPYEGSADTTVYSYSSCVELNHEEFYDEFDFTASGTYDAKIDITEVVKKYIAEKKSQITFMIYCGNGDASTHRIYTGSSITVE